MPTDVNKIFLVEEDFGTALATAKNYMALIR